LAREHSLAKEGSYPSSSTKRRKKEEVMALKVRDCAECGDQNLVKEMYPQEGSLICEFCLLDSLAEEDK
jgi:formylmethanofuran dehydrogenase subunit E